MVKSDKISGFGIWIRESSFYGNYSKGDLFILRNLHNKEVNFINKKGNLDSTFISNFLILPFSILDNLN